MSRSGSTGSSDGICIMGSIASLSASAIVNSSFSAINLYVKKLNPKGQSHYSSQERVFIRQDLSFASISFVLFRVISWLLFLSRRTGTTKYHEVSRKLARKPHR